MEAHSMRLGAMKQSPHYQEIAHLQQKQNSAKIQQ
jgi:hypothetical protein